MEGIMRLITKFLFLIVVSILMTTACQAENPAANFPDVCTQEGFHYDGQNLILDKDSEQSLFVFTPTTQKTFWLNHPIGNDPGASAGWASELEPRNWSALTLSGSSEDFAITCSLIGGDGIKYIDCSQALMVCKITDATFKSKNLGSFWVAENQPRQDLLEAIRSRGIEVEE